MQYVEVVKQWFHTNANETWTWLSTLSQQEWLVLLGIVAALGFLCMRGFTHRGTL